MQYNLHEISSDRKICVKLSKDKINPIVPNQNVWLPSIKVFTQILIIKAADVNEAGEKWWVKKTGIDL
jgi:hypothetical protein